MVTAGWVAMMSFGTAVLVAAVGLAILGSGAEQAAGVMSAAATAINLLMIWSDR
jgi:hypothetical protein